ncbi:acyltransferase family protein [Arthrobacter mobilis]|uniref:Acyltransferase family protein n=1 Tax=Arthrobacter mobilis TaxID=2724944 RepID=A0A7X6QM75_9MICC|nr:acyltransferase family protein [Arthrobacter mobilis]NKX56492.1 acyltransferase family protein [Arthrobacter mobilis]
MTTDAAPAPAHPQDRQTWIDQARWAAIVLVVAGHAVGLLRTDSGLALLASNFVYMFHIPVLVLLAGWGARRSQAGGEGLARIFQQLLLPYVVFQLLAFGVNYLVEDDTPSWSFTEQTFGLWFLVALAGWRLLAPWFRGLQFRGLPLAVPAAAGLALAAGLSPQIGGFLSLSRILVFLPLFLAGPWIVDRISVWRRDRRARMAGAAVLAAGAAVTLALRGDFWRTPFLGSSGYADLGLGSAEGMLWRLLVLAAGAVMATAFMLALPGRSGAPSRAGAWTARAGQYTMYPYLLHLPLLTVVDASPLVQSAGSPLHTALFMAASALFCVLAVWQPVVALARPLVDPRAAWTALRPAGRDREPTRTAG